MNISVQISVQVPALNSFEYIPRSGIATSYTDLIFLVTPILFFHKGYVILHPHQQCTRVLISPHPYRHLSFYFLIIAIIVDVNYTVVLICIFMVLCWGFFHGLMGHLYIFFGEMSAYMLNCFSRVRLSAALFTVAHRALLSMGFSRQEYCSGLRCPPPGDLPHPGTEPVALTSPAFAGRFFTH